MFDRLESALRHLRDITASVDQDHVSGRDAVRVVQLLTEIERVAVAARTIAIGRVERSRVWQKEGHRTISEWVASTTGTTLGHAIGVVETAHRLQDLPATRQAFCTGQLSEIQAREIAGAASVDPKAETMLLASAGSRSVTGLREDCHRVRAAAISDEVAAQEASRRRRYLRYWTDTNGDVRLDARLPAVDGAQVIAAIDARRDRISIDGRRSGVRESSEAYAADALVELARTATTDGDSTPRATVHVVVDHAVLASGRATAEQRCEIPGVGPIPAGTARALAGDAILKAVLMRGADVTAVRHLGRTIPARIRTALQIRDPVCVVPRCDKRRGLEMDHYRIPFVDGGPSTLDNLARICGWHHFQKTYMGYRLSGAPGCWRWQRPSDLEGSPIPLPT